MTKFIKYFLLIITTMGLLLLITVNGLIYYLNANPQTITNLLSDQLGVKLAITNSEFSITSTTLQLKTGAINSPNFTVEDLLVQLNLWQSLTNLHPKLNTLTITRPKLNLALGNNTKSTKLTNLDIIGVLSPILASNNTVKIINGSVNLTNSVKKTLAVTKIELQLTPNNTSLNFNFNNSQTQISWQPQQQFLSGKLQVKAHNIPVAEIAHIINPKQQFITTGKADFTGRFNLTAGKVVNASAQLKLKQLTPADENQRLVMPEFTVNFDINRQNQQRYLKIYSQLPKFNDSVGFTLQAVAIEQPSQLQIKISKFDLSNITYFLPWLKLDSQSFTASGNLENITINLPKPFSSATANINAELKQVGLITAKKLPTFNSLSGQMQLTKTKLKLKLHSKNLTVTSNLLLKPLALGKFSTQFELQLNPNQTWQATAKNLTIDGKFLQTKVNLKLYSIAGKPSPGIDLTSDFSINSIATIKNLMPVAANSELRKWFNAAFISGKISNGKIKFIGDLNKYPFQNQQDGEFLVSLNLHNAHFSFVDDWQNLQQLDGILTIDRQYLNFTATAGHLANIKFKQLSATVDDLIADVPLLTIKTKIDSKLKLARNLLLNSPLKNSVGLILDNLGVAGNAKVALDMLFPLHPTDGKIKVSGSVNLANNSLYIKAASLPITAIKGVVKFSENSVTINNLNGIALGGKVKASLTTVVPFDQNNSQLKLKLQGQAAIASINRWAQFPLPKMSGLANWQASIDLAENNLNRMQISLDLAAAQIYLPDIIDKPKKSPLDATINLSWDDDQLQVQFQLDKYLQGIINKTQSNLSGGIAANQAKLVISDTNLTIQAKLKGLHVKLWQDWIKHNIKISNAKSKPLKFSIQIDTKLLQLENSAYENVKLDIGNNKHGWQTRIISPKITGDIFIPNVELKPIIIKLSKYTLDSSGAESQPMTTTIKTTTKLEQDKLFNRETYIDINTLMFKGKNIGNASLRIYPTNTGANINNIVVKTNDYRLTGNGQWHQAKNRTNLILNLNGKNLAAVLTNFSYQGKIALAPVTASLQLNWASNPSGFSLLGLNGKANLIVDAGVLVDIDNTSSSKIFSLMGLQNLAQRLTLNFEDINVEGLAFDSIKGDFTINNGIVSTNNTKLNGNSVNISFMGNTNLHTSIMDFKVVVNPRLSDTFPIIVGSTTGMMGFIAGLIVSTYNKLTNNVIDKTINSSYQLTGTWQQPIIK